jgi:ornithine--oxo-acid transaminase
VRPLVEELMKAGLLAKDTHEMTLRLAPPLVITKSQADKAFRVLRDTLARWAA